jgi:phosphatidylglycerophosphate synthase
VQQNLLNKRGAKLPVNEEQKSKKLRYLPSIISIQRLVVLPFLILSLEYRLILVGYGLFLFAIGTDFADGYLAKKLCVTTKFGAYLDATFDFFFVVSMLLYFVVKGFYPVWLLFPIILVYVQFVLTSLLSKVIYDPVRKYYGSLLYGAVGLTLLFSGQLIYVIVTAGIMVATAASLLSRLLHLFRVCRSEQSQKC